MIYKHNGIYTSRMPPDAPCDSERAANFALSRLILLQNVFYNVYQRHDY